MLSGFQFYKTYCSLNLHFSGKYDVLKYGDRLKSLNMTAYEKRKEKFKFMAFATKLQDERSAYHHCVANFMHNNSNWLYEPFSESDAIHKNWRKYFDAFEYNFKQEFNVLNNVMESNNAKFETMLLQTESGRKPPLLQLMLTRKVSPEFIIKLDSRFQFIDTWYDLYLKHDPLVETIIFKLKKYSPLLNLLRKELGT
jgi:hypothetical protein